MMLRPILLALAGLALAGTLAAAPPPAIPSPDLSGLERIVDGPTESVRQLEVWRETESTLEVAKDLARRTSAL